MSTPRERLRLPVEGPPGRGHGSGWARPQSQWGDRRRISEIPSRPRTPTYAEILSPPPTPRFTPSAAGKAAIPASASRRKVARHVPARVAAAASNNNSLKYDGSRYNQNAPVTEDDGNATDYQVCIFTSI